ncbi:MAG: hypothetical protein L6311_10595 [Cellulomonas sp.]|nr:hypothetical protein [Cellulomonas sp.]
MPFTTYGGARTTERGIDEGRVHRSAGSRSGWNLELVPERRQGGLLHAPVHTAMHRRVHETLDASVQVRLRNPAGGTVLEGTGRAAGLEVHGDRDRPLSAR